MGNTYKEGSVKASYAKDEEKKYNDRAIGAGFTQYGFGNAGTSTTANAITSVGFKSGSWYGFNFNQPLASGSAITQDLLKGIGTGTSTTTRVGNKVKSIYIKGSILITANQENSGASSDDQTMGSYRLVRSLPMRKFPQWAMVTPLSLSRLYLRL